MVEALKPYLCVIRDTLDFALNLRNFPSLIYEKMNRPQIEVLESLELVNRPIVICRNEEEKVEIEPSINSVRINIVTKKHADLESLLVLIYSNYIMNRSDKLNIFRKKPKQDYDISMLITNFHLENYKKEVLIDYVIEFIQDLEKELNDMKLIVNSQCRIAASYFMENLKF